SKNFRDGCISNPKPLAGAGTRFIRTNIEQCWHLRKSPCSCEMIFGKSSALPKMLAAKSIGPDLYKAFAQFGHGTACGFSICFSLGEQALPDTLLAAATQALHLCHVGAHEFTAEDLVEIVLGVVRQLLLVGREQLPELRLAVQAQAAGAFFQFGLERLRVDAPDCAKQRR